MLEIGTTAPAFSLLDQTETVQTLAANKGFWTVIYFYPKDDTPGCTKEACAIAEIYDEFEKMQVAVFGVSKDTPASHAKFAAKYNLPFRLLSDPEATMIAAYGAFKEKSMFGKGYLGIVRMTYVVDPEGKIAKVYPKVDPASHAVQILKDLKELMG